ncbi:MAG: alpha/beta hydrolase [Blastomonas sp.]
MTRFSRRTVLAGMAGSAALAGHQAGAKATRDTSDSAADDAIIAASPAVKERLVAAQTAWKAPPVITPAREGPIQLAETSLWHQDMGGTGEAVILLHAWTGSYAFWPYQQEALAAAGYRVISYSARGHYRSAAIDPDNPGTSTGDLAALIDELGISRAHIIGTAGGGLAALDYALSRPGRVLSLTVSSSHMGIADPEFLEVGGKMVPRGVYGIDHAFSELGPSYRAANRPGTEAWKALEHLGWQGGPVRQKTETPNMFDRIAKIAVPALFITGGADMMIPPARMREVVARAPGSELVTVAEAGHSVSWEQPEAFNSVVLEHFWKHHA